LLLGGIEFLRVEDYTRIAQIEVEAIRLGYRDFNPETAAQELYA